MSERSDLLLSTLPDTPPEQSVALILPAVDWANAKITRPALEASAEEVQAMQTRLANPPKFEGSGLSSKQDYDCMLAETRQIIAARLAAPRSAEHFMGPIINMEASAAVAKYFRERGDPSWELLPITDLQRSTTNRSTTFGQFGSQFLAHWPARRRLAAADGAPGQGATMQRPLFVQIEISAVLHDEPVVLPDPTGLLRAAMKARGDRSWLIQVDVGTPMASWFKDLFETWRLGQIKGAHESLGGFGMAMAEGAEKVQLTGLLLPRGRGDPGTKPWHVGEFIRREDGHLIWRTVCKNAAGAIVEAKFRLELRAQVFAKEDSHPSRN